MHSNTFHMSASNQAKNGEKRNSVSSSPVLATSVLSSDKAMPAHTSSAQFMDNPLYDPDKMVGAVHHANRVTRTYGVEVNVNMLMYYESVCLLYIDKRVCIVY